MEGSGSAPATPDARMWSFHMAKVVECPACGYCFDADHTDCATDRYSCANCGYEETELAALLRELQSASKSSPSVLVGETE